MVILQSSFTLIYEQEIYNSFVTFIYKEMLVLILLYLLILQFLLKQ